ncbi:MAG: NUMOD1 domain-containing DNA-binding protein [Chitinophagaceae bacterium]
MQQTKKPYQDLSLKNIKKEIWEDIPGLDGYFAVSDYGRVKRMEYTHQYRNGAIYTIPEKIIKPGIVQQGNAFKGDVTKHLITRVVIEGVRHSFTIVRLVYYCFVEPFDLEDAGIMILTKDCDNFNIRPSNLVKATWQQRQQRVVERGRAESPLLYLSEEEKQYARLRCTQATSRQVSQYSIKGRRIRIYKSAAAAGRATGVHSQSICKVANGKKNKAGGFLWAWGKEKEVAPPDGNERRRKFRLDYGLRVTQYDLQGNRIAQFPSIKDAAESTGVSGSAIGAVVKNKYKSAGGFFWKKGHGKIMIDLSAHLTGRASMAVTQSKSVKQYTLDGKYIASFASVKEAAQAMGAYSGAISSACRGIQKSACGYQWKFSSDSRFKK